jgi:hypothetical protein
MSPQFLRAVFLILAVRAIFLSPVQGSEFGPRARLDDSSLKKVEAIRPFRLRYTKPCPPSTALERLDCIDGGNDGDDDERTRPAQPVLEAWPISALSGSAVSERNTVGILVRGFVRLRC